MRLRHGWTISPSLFILVVAGLHAYSPAFVVYLVHYISSEAEAPCLFCDCCFFGIIILLTQR